MHAELAAALPLARQAQATWKTLPRAARKVDDALWKELRELVDPWFNQADEKQRERHAAESAVADEARSILDELAQLAHDTAALAQADARLSALQTRWRTLADSLPAAEEPPAPRDRKPVRPARAAPRAGLDERALDRAVAKVREAQSQHAETARREELNTLLHAAELCDQLDGLRADAPESRRAELAAKLEALALAGDARTACQHRLRAALDPEGSLPLDAEGRSPQQQAEELTVLAELACDIESPPQARELRRRLQIERLSERLSGGAGAGHNELRPLLLHYLRLEGVPAETRAALTPRWKLATTKG